jgi:hypothetical protein
VSFTPTHRCKTAAISGFVLTGSSVQKYRDGLTIDAFGLPPMATAVAKTMPLSMLKLRAADD